MAIVVLVPLHNFQECARIDLFDNKQLSLKSKLLKLVLLKKKKKSNWCEWFDVFKIKTEFLIHPAV